MVTKTRARPRPPLSQRLRAQLRSRFRSQAYSRLRSRLRSRVRRVRQVRPALWVGLCLGVLALLALTVIGSVARMDQLSVDSRYDTVDTVPSRSVALVLGNKVSDDGSPGTVLTRRLETALALYEAGKVSVVLVSGDGDGGAGDDYDEVGAMRQWMIDHGVPSDAIVSDEFGFDTYDSCVRAVDVYDVTEAIVVTQNYHLARAVALCREVGMDAVGVVAGTREIGTVELRRREIREDLASVKAVLDLLLRPDPQETQP